MAKKKKLLKKLAKAALIGGALYGGSKLLKNRKAKSIADMDNAGIHVKHNAMKDFGPYTHKRFDPTTVAPDFSLGASAAKGGRIGKKGGGRIGKQFGGGLGSTARRDMRSGYYPKDMGMRGGTMYKKGGRVKSMGIAKRGGGVAKR